MIGSILGSQVVGSFIGVNIKEKGSGNPGATNMMRVKGKKAAFTTLVIDILKPILAFGILVSISTVWVDGIIQIGLLGVLVGHCYPWTSGFKGGKGVATTFGLMFVFNWVIALSIFLCWIIIFKATKISSLTSLISFWIIGSLIWIPVFWQEPSSLSNLFYSGFYNIGNIPYTPITIMITNLFVTWRHKSNIYNIINGNERQTTFSKEGQDEKELSKVSSSHKKAKLNTKIKKQPK